MDVLMLLSGKTFARLCQDLFALAQVPHAERGIQGGWRWEQRIADHLARVGFPVDSIPGGVRVFGVVPASGLRHQTDAAIACIDAHVIGEWKSYTGAIPKNELLRFKASTDDLYDALVEHRPRRPVLRLFGVSGDARDALRRYAARHGIALVERTRWPAPVLADPLIPWNGEAPSAIDRRTLAWLSRPLQDVYPRLPDGSLRLPRPLPSPAVESLLDLHERWSERLWDLIEREPGAFEAYAGAMEA